MTDGDLTDSNAANTSSKTFGEAVEAIKKTTGGLEDLVKNSPGNPQTRELFLGRN